MRWFCSKHPKKGHFENHRCVGLLQARWLALLYRPNATAIIILSGAATTLEIKVRHAQKFNTTREMVTNEQPSIANPQGDDFKGSAVR